MRTHFHEELEALEMDILGMGEFTERAIQRAVEALVTGDVALANEVIAEDDVVDARYLDVEQRIMQLLALQTPVASDLRMVTTLLHSNLHLERIADMAVNVANIGRSVVEYPKSDRVLGRVQEMGDLVRPMIRTAMEALARRDLDLATKLTQMDDPVDRLNMGIYGEVLALADDRRLLEWGLRMIVISRLLERAGDHVVDIGEQVAFLVTGEFHEFTDASHPMAPGADGL